MSYFFSMTVVQWSNQGINISWMKATIGGFFSQVYVFTKSTHIFRSEEVYFNPWLSHR
jgi:hypothetical protein